MLPRDVTSLHCSAHSKDPAEICRRLYCHWTYPRWLLIGGRPSSFWELLFLKTWSGRHKLYPQKGPAENVLSAETEEVWSVTGAVEWVLYRSHLIHPAHIHSLVRSSHKTGWEQTAVNSNDNRKTHVAYHHYSTKDETTELRFPTYRDVWVANYCICRAHLHRAHAFLARQI